MSTDFEYFAVDRIEADLAVLVADSGGILEVPHQQLPIGVRPGSVIKAPRGPSGEIEWGSAELDEAEAEERLARAESILRELRKRDPGGDISL